MWMDPGSSDSKESACNVGDLGSIPGSGRSPGEGNGNSLQYSGLEDPMDGAAWWATLHGVSKSRTWLRDQHFHFLMNEHIQGLGHWSTSFFSCHLCVRGTWMWHLDWNHQTSSGPHASDIHLYVFTNSLTCCLSIKSDPSKAEILLKIYSTVYQNGIIYYHRHCPVEGWTAGREWLVCGQALVIIESSLAGFTFLMFRRVFHELASTLCLSNLISSHISGALNQATGS